MKRLIIIFLFFVTSVVVCGQKIKFQYERINLRTIDSIEVAQNARRFEYDYSIGVSKDYFPNRENYNLAQPIVYRKSIKNFQFETSYYYSLPDSTIRLVEYWWEDTLSSKKHILELLKKNNMQMFKHFNYYGKFYKGSFQKSEKVIWEDKSVHIEEFYTTEMLHRLRVLISWK